MARKHTAFLKGELIDLCVPSPAALADGWGDWFNEAETTRFLGQGVFPNRPEDQEAFYRGLETRQRLALMICDKAGDQLWGVISLSSIDWVARSAQIALVLPAKQRRPALAALEAMARMTEHGFETLGLERIWAGQAYPGLARWNQRLELLGYLTEGVLRRGFAKGRTTSDSVMISALHVDYAAIKARRPYWPGAEAMAALIERLPAPPLADRLAAAIRREQKAYARELKAAETEQG